MSMLVKTQDRKVAKTIKIKEKDLKIPDEMIKSKDNDKGSRPKLAKHKGTSLQRRQRQRSQELHDKSNLNELTKECHNELTSGEIVSLKILNCDEPPLRSYELWKKTFYKEALREIDQMHQTCEKSSIEMTHKLDDTIELPESRSKETYKEDLECEMVIIKIHRCMLWLGSTDTYDEPI
nr:hypothetical protein [Tanacetum cinerariifolium]